MTIKEVSINYVLLLLFFFGGFCLIIFPKLSVGILSSEIRLKNIEVMGICDCVPNNLM